jgi:antitoxin CcdA
MIRSIYPTIHILGGCTTLGYVTVSARIRRELYEKLKKYGVNVSYVIRRALEEEVRRREEEEVAKMLDKAQEILARIPSEELVEAIRASREER